MSNFNTKFDLVTEETFAAPAAVAVMLDVAVPAYVGGTWSSDPANIITAGTIVKIDAASGKAVKASSAALNTAFPAALGASATQSERETYAAAYAAALSAAAPILPLVVIDGNDTFSGAFTGKLTCLAGGFQMKTGEITGVSWTKGAPVSFELGKVVAWAPGKQVFGYVGKDGFDSAKGQLHVIVTGGR